MALSLPSISTHLRASFDVGSTELSSTTYYPIAMKHDDNPAAREESAIISGAELKCDGTTAGQAAKRKGDGHDEIPKRWQQQYQRQRRITVHKISYTTSSFSSP
jgi:hypothetical protein